MKTISVSEARDHLDQLIENALNGQRVVVGRGKRRVILKPLAPSDFQLEEAQFRAAFPPAVPEPRNAADRIRRVLHRVRRAR